MSGVLEQDGGEQGGKGATAYDTVNVCLASLSLSTPHERDSKGFKGHTHKGKENKRSTSRWRSECHCGRPTAEGAGTVRSQQARERSSPPGWEGSRYKASPCSLQTRRAQELATVASEGGW